MSRRPPSRVQITMECGFTPSLLPLLLAALLLPILRVPLLHNTRSPPLASALAVPASSSREASAQRYEPALDQDLEAVQPGSASAADPGPDSEPGAGAGPEHSGQATAPEENIQDDYLEDAHADLTTGNRASHTRTLDHCTVHIQHIIIIRVLVIINL